MTELALVFTDLVDSTRLVETLGDAAAAQVWSQHDRRGRELVARHAGREIDHTDGFFLVFDSAPEAAGFALGYQQAMAELGLSARVGIHVGEVTLRRNAADDVARGAKAFEVEGLAKPLAARVMSHARGGQTLLTRGARDALAGALPAGAALESHGHYRLKGIADPIELFELGLRGASAFAPPPDSEKVYRVARAGDGLWRPLRDVRHNLEAERDAFVGREQELQRLARRLDAGARLVSVLGPGGSGKTRFVRRYAWTWLGDWPGGVCFCDLSEARSLDGILGAVAVALDVPLSGADPAAQIGHAIAARGRCLVVLDNFEQVLRDAAATVGRWAGRAGGAAFVVTSRERLHLEGEEVFALEPLALADDAVALFQVRAAAQRPGFALTDANRPAIEEIVRLLDGLPLAIELAAARVRVLSPAQIVLRLQDRFALLAGARGASARQATLRAAIDWSWDLLAAWEQSALAQCAVFEGGFTLEAAERVLDLAPWPDAPPALDAVQALVDKSLLRSWTPAGGGRYDLDELYFGMYVSVREYAGEKLRAQGPAALRAAEQRHGQCFAAFGSDEAIDALYLHDGTRRRRALRLELDNLIAACRRAVARGDGTTALASYRAAWEVLDLQGPFATSDALGRQVAAMDGLDAALRTSALIAAAAAARRAGRLEPAGAALQEALALACQAGDSRREANARSNLGGLLRDQGRIDEARAQLEAGLHLQRALGNRRAEGTTLTSLGALHGDLGETDRALAYYAQALDVHRAIGNRIDEANVLLLIGVQLAQTGALEPARAQFEASLAISEAIEDRVTMGEILTNLGTLALEQGRPQQAVDRYERALAIHREVGNRRFEGYVQGDIGRMHLEQGRPDDARPALEHALAIARETGERRQQGAVLRSLGELGLRCAQPVAARTAFEEAEALLRAVGDRRYLAEVLCGRGELALAEGDRDGARPWLAEAQSLAAATGAGPDSDLGRRLALLAQALGEPGPKRRGA